MEARLVNLLRATIDDLDGIWRKIGFSAKERSEQSEALFAEVTDLFRTKIEQEGVLLETYQENIHHLRGEISHFLTRLDQTPDDAVCSSEESASLVTVLSRLKQEHALLAARCQEYDLQMADKFAELESLTREMGEEEFVRPTEFKLTADSLNAVAHDCAVARKERDRRAELMAKDRTEVFDLLECLEPSPLTSLDRVVLDHGEVSLSKVSLAAMHTRFDELNSLKLAQSALLLQLFAQIRPLWEKLGVTSSEQEAFFARQGGSLGDKAVRACQVEIARLKEVLKSKMSLFIDHTRTEIVAKRQELALPPLGPFPCVPVEDFAQCEAVLQEHESQLADLNKQLEALKPIRQGVAKYLALFEERIQYQALIQDSSRLLSRNKRNSGLPSLAEEEKMRLRVASIPKLVAQLKQLLLDAENGVPGGRKIRIGVDQLGGGDEATTTTIECIEAREREHEEKMLREKRSRKEQITAPAPAFSKPFKKPTTTSTTAPLRPKN